jgi:Kelch motif
MTYRSSSSEVGLVEPHRDGRPTRPSGRFPLRLASAVVIATMVMTAMVGTSSASSAGWTSVASVDAGSGQTTTAAVKLAWHRIPSMHTGRYDAGAEFDYTGQFYEDRIFVIGGFDSHGAALSSVESFDLDYNRWTAAAPMPTARGDFGVNFEGRNSPITVFGGADSHGKLLKIVEQYDPAANHWSHLTTLPQARRGLAAADEGDGGMIAGGIGAGGKVLNSVMELVENLPKHGDLTWRSLAPMHMRRYDFALVVGGDVNNGSELVYAIGGFGPGHRPLRSVEAYNPRTNHWTMKAPMPTGRGGLAAQPSNYRQLITVAGGFGSRGRALKTVEQYNVAKNSWAPQRPMPVARGGLALVDTAGGSRPGLFALGGRGANGAVLASASAREAVLPKDWSLETPLPHRQASVVAARDSTGIIYTFSGSTVDAFDPSTHMWSVRAPLPPNVGPFAAAPAPDGKIYVMGGGAEERTNEAYDPTTNSWTVRAPIPVGRLDAAAVTGKDGKIYVLGGAKPDPDDNSNSLYPRSLDVYDPKTNSWGVQAPMPTGREGLGAAVGPDGTIYAIGGGTDHYDRYFKCFSVVEAYSPGADRWSRMPSLPKQMCGVTAGATSEGNIDAVAGSTIAGGEESAHITAVTGTILAFNPGANRWTVLSRTPFPRIRAGAVVAPNGTVYVIGGADGFGNATPTVQKCTRCGSG